MEEKEVVCGCGTQDFNVYKSAAQTFWNNYNNFRWEELKLDI
jgi:hypothetical protein